MATTRGAYESFNTNGFETRLTTEASAIDTVFYLQTTQGLTSPFYMVIDPEDIGQREYVFIDGNVTSTSVEIADANQDNRYLEGSGASSGLTHTAGTTVRLAPTLQHFEDLWDANQVGSLMPTKLATRIVSRAKSGMLVLKQLRSGNSFG